MILSTDGTPFSIICSSRRPAKHDGRENNNFLPVNHHFRFYYDQDKLSFELGILRASLFALDSRFPDFAY